MYEKSIRGNIAAAKDQLIQLYIYSINAENKEQTMQGVLALIWNDLLAGSIFTEQTLTYLSQCCQKEISERLKASPQGNSLSFLKSLKMNPHHPLTRILDNENVPENNLKLIMKHARALLYTRWAFFNPLPPQQEYPLDELPQEIKEHIFSFVQPEIKNDIKAGYFLAPQPL